MKIDLYTLTWNEAPVLEFFFRQYDSIVSRYVVFDDGSTDGTREMLLAHPKVELRDAVLQADPASLIRSARLFGNECWKESRGATDWIIALSIDEHLDHPDLLGYLARCKREGITIVPALGYQMLTPRFPASGEKLSETRRIGVPFDPMNKLCVFSPRHIEATNWSDGQHTASPTGNVVAPPRDELRLLHYKYLGFRHLVHRNEASRRRLRSGDFSDPNLAHRWKMSRKALRDDWRSFARQLRYIPQDRLLTPAPESPPPWWNRFRRTGFDGAEPKFWD
jgi:glycosyltransferase involved in cell wall biosynthesis